jgi:hypothetical protein
MPGIAIAVVVAVVLLVVAVPQARRAVFSLLGLFAIITLGSAIFGALVWGLYEAKPWLTERSSVVVREEAPESATSAPSEDVDDLAGTAEADLASALAEEEAERLDAAQQRLAEQKLHKALLVAKARVIMEEDRKLAAQATAYPLPAGARDLVGDIMAIRIPAWRDKAVQSAQKQSIRKWLTSLGLEADETAGIVTAKAWGSLYDLWIAENPDAAPKASSGPPPVTTTSTEPEPASGESEAAAPEPAPSAPSEAALTLPPVRNPIPAPRRAPRPSVPRRYRAPPPPPKPRWMPPPEREVGPFGY